MRDFSPSGERRERERERFPSATYVYNIRMCVIAALAMSKEKRFFDRIQRENVLRCSFYNTVKTRYYIYEVTRDIHAEFLSV